MENPGIRFLTLQLLTGILVPEIVLIAIALEGKGDISVSEAGGLGSVTLPETFKGT